MAKKIYAVKTGKIQGLFHTWEACKASVDSVPGACYKGFATVEEACAFLGVKEAVFQDEEAGQITLPLSVAPMDIPQTDEGELLVYVDGSYEDSIKKYAFGCVFILSDGRIFTQFGNGSNEDSLKHRNVTGEMLGAMYAVKTAMANGYRAVRICYDYEGIEKWFTGEWKAKNDHTQKYAEAMRGWASQIAIRFQKVTAHSNVTYNEMADQTAKRGLTEGNGVPRIGRIEDMIPWKQ